MVLVPEKNSETKGRLIGMKADTKLKGNIAAAELLGAGVATGAGGGGGAGAGAGEGAGAGARGVSVPVDDGGGGGGVVSLRGGSAGVRRTGRFTGVRRTGLAVAPPAPDVPPVRGVVGLEAGGSTTRTAG